MGQLRTIFPLMRGRSLVQECLRKCHLSLFHSDNRGSNPLGDANEKARPARAFLLASFGVQSAAPGSTSDMPAARRAGRRAWRVGPGAQCSDERIAAGRDASNPLGVPVVSRRWKFASPFFFVRVKKVTQCCRLLSRERFAKVDPEAFISSTLRGRPTRRRPHTSHQFRAPSKHGIRSDRCTWQFRVWSERHLRYLMVDDGCWVTLSATNPHWDARGVKSVADETTRSKWSCSQTQLPIFTKTQ